MINQRYPEPEWHGKDEDDFDFDTWEDGLYEYYESQRDYEAEQED